MLTDSPVITYQTSVSRSKFSAFMSRHNRRARNSNPPFVHIGRAGDQDVKCINKLINGEKKKEWETEVGKLKLILRG